MPTTLTIVPWVDPIIDTIGHDPRSRYAETFWLPTLGPTSLLLLRHLANRFDDTLGSRRLELRIADTSLALGVGDRDGATSPILRTLGRLEQFDLACADPRSPTIAVRRNLPPMTRRHVQRLPLSLQALHREWAAARLTEPPHSEARRRARRLALRLTEQGDDPDHIEATLGTIGFHPAVGAEAARWAVEEHERTAEAADVGA
jgi:hypothetical protein